VSVMKRASGRGYALIAALILVMLVSLAATIAVNAAQLDAQREREAQLLFIGNQFRDALGSYNAAPVGGIAQYPETIEQLLVDDRWQQARHHLRRMWPDPITRSMDWELVRSQGRIIGIHSRSKAVPLKRANFDRGNDFADALNYSEWVFTARDPGAEAAPAQEQPK